MDSLAAEAAHQDSSAPDSSPQVLLSQGAQRMNIDYFMQLTSIEHHDF